MLPKNGSIVIIDDVYSEAAPLMSFFSKNSCPYLYYTGDFGELPGVPNKEVRIVFLDFNLLPAITGAHSTNTQILSILDKIIGDDNGPYLLVVWSKNHSDAESLKAEIVEKIKTNHARGVLLPFNTLSLEKSDFFARDNETYEFIDGKEQELSDKINSKLNSAKFLNYLLSWENALGESSKDTVSQATNAISSISQDSDDYPKHFISVLAKTLLDKKLSLSSTDEKIKASYNSLSKVHLNLFENKFEKIDTTQINVEIENDYSPNFSDVNIGAINSWLNINYLNNNSHKGKVVQKSGFSSSGLIDTTKDGRELNEIITCIREENATENYVYKEVELEISPDCDVAQNKRTFYRLVSGCQISKDLFEKLSHRRTGYFKNSFPISFFKSGELLVKIENEMIPSFFIFNLSQIKTISVGVADYFDDSLYICNFNNDLLSSIKIQLSNNIQKHGYQSINI